MNISARDLDPRATGVVIGEDVFVVALEDGRELSVPLAWFPRLLAGSVEARRNWRLVGPGIGIHWPELDEDVSVASLLVGPGVAHARNAA